MDAIRSLKWTLPMLEENLALDEALLLEAEEAQGAEYLRFWEWPHRAVILGAGGQIQQDVHVDACIQSGVQIARRSSGGGTVLLGPGCLLYTLVLSYERHPALKDVNASYRYILNRLQEGLISLCPPNSQIAMAGICDLTFNGRKFSGNAQQRKAKYVLHHGTFLLHFDLPQIEQFLKMPDRKPDYRGDRPHLDFVGNLPTTSQAIEDSLGQIWEASPTTPDALSPTITRLPELIQEKYALQEWVYRR